MENDERQCVTHHICDCMSQELTVVKRKLEIAVKYLEECCPNLNFKALVHMAEAHLK